MTFATARGQAMHLVGTFPDTLLFRNFVQSHFEKPLPTLAVCGHLARFRPLSFWIEFDGVSHLTRAGRHRPTHHAIFTIRTCVNIVPGSIVGAETVLPGVGIKGKNR
jgi:hypothetical protein